MHCKVVLIVNYFVGIRQVHVLLPVQPEQRVRCGRHQEGQQDQVRQPLHQPKLLR